MSAFIIGIILVVGATFLWAIIMALPVMLLWNAVVPDIFSLPEIGFWQALGLTLLCSFLFKGSSSSSNYEYN